MNRDDKIYVAGHKGLVGSAILRLLISRGFGNIIYKTHAELDLINQADVEDYFEKERPDYVFLTAALVGGINANNSYPADFIYENLQVQTNVIHSSCKYQVKRLLFLGSSCVYPRECPQPIKEEYLLTGTLEPTNEPYAIAKIAGIKMCQSYKRQYGMDSVSVMSTNLYGPGDNFDLETSHVLPALIKKIHDAKMKKLDRVEIWGTGTPKREFLHVDDLADACLFVMEEFNDDIINIGYGEDISISDLAKLICSIVGFKGDIRFNTTMPDGTPRKILDVSRLKSLGWQAKISLSQGIKRTYEWYTDQNK